MPDPKDFRSADQSPAFDGTLGGREDAAALSAHRGAQQRVSITIRIDGREEPHPGGLTSGSELQELAGTGGGRLFLSRKRGIDVPIGSTDHIVLRGTEEFVTGNSDLEDNPPLRKPIQPLFNGERSVEFRHAKVSGAELKGKDSVFPAGRLFVEVPGGVDREVADSMMLLVQPEDSFFVIPAEAEPDPSGSVDVEQCARHGRRPPRGGRYRLRVDGSRFADQKPEITGSQILDLVGKRPDEWSLNQKHRDGRRERIEPDQVVDLATPGLERFETVRKQAPQGTGARTLLPEDVQYLDATYPDRWSMTAEGNGKQGLLIDGFPVPAEYQACVATLMVQVPSGYPGTNLDMFYFDPPLAKRSGHGIPCLVSERHFGRDWQRWSRHPEWRPGEDTLVSYLEYIRNELETEGLR